MTSVAVLGIVFATGCAETRTGGAMVEPESWSEVSEANDPFDDRPAEVTCSEDAWGEEELSGEMTLEIDTTACNYVVLSQPNLVEVLAGDTLSSRLWHFDLNYEASAEAHAAISTAQEILWEEWFPIPSESGMSAPEWVATSDIEIGEEIYFHLHNHGSNAWNFIELLAAPAP